MDTQRLIVVAAAVVQLALWLVLAGRYKTPTSAPGNIVLHYGWKVRFLGLCTAFATPMAMIMLSVVTYLRHTPQLLALDLTILASGFIGGALLIETQGAHLIVTETTLISVSPWRRRRAWRWNEIEKVTCSFVSRWVNYWLVLHGPQRQVIHASLLLVGIRDLAQTLLRHVPVVKCAPARNVLDRLAGAPR